MLFLASLLVLAGTDLEAAAPKPANKADAATNAQKPIIVTAIRLKDSADAVRRCVERHCPPDQDIAAALAHAENQFISGDYRGARNTLNAARGRDRRFASKFPVQVASLVRASARVSAHLGEGESYRIETIDALDALKQGLPGDDPRVLAGRLEIGDMQARLGALLTAQRIYEDTADRAKRLGVANVEGLALLRLANLFDKQGSEEGKLSPEAERILDGMIAEKDPQKKSFVGAALLLKAQMANRAHDPRAPMLVEQAIKTLPGTSRPVLVFAPSIADIGKSARGVDGRADFIEGVAPTSPAGRSAWETQLDQLATQNFDDQWVDIAFFVTPDGHVSEPDVIRKSSKLDDSGWVKQLLASIAARRYLPLDRDANDPGVARVERYTLTSLWRKGTGTGIQQRSVDGHIEMLDLSVDAPPAKPAASN